MRRLNLPSDAWVIDACRAALDARLERGSSRTLVVAYSGGSDSLALLLICRDWARQAGRNLTAITVDHGLHADSGAWTASAGRTAQSLGVAWRALAWTGEKPATGVPAAARAARHRLLAQAARDLGARVILFGHTADDVLESEVMRLEIPGLGRLHGWSPSPAWPEGREVFLLRPMLHARRTELRALVQARGRRWLEDPGNADLRHARSRARSQLAAGAAEPEGKPLSTNEGADLRAATSRLAQLSSITLDGRLETPRRCIEVLDSASARRSLGVLLTCAAGAGAPPRGATLSRLADRLRGPELFTASLGGARVVANVRSVIFAREAGEHARRGSRPTPLTGDRPAVFDGRFEGLADPGALSDNCLASLCGRISQLNAQDRAALRNFPAYARAALPVMLAPERAPSLPRPFGAAPGWVRQLVGERLAAACGLVSREADIGRAFVERLGGDVAPKACSPYVDR